MTRRRHLSLALLALILSLPAAAHADWDFGEHVWLEATSGLGGFTGIEKDAVSLTMRSTIGVRIEEDFGVEVSLDAAVDVLAGLNAFGVSAQVAFFPGTDAVRLRVGPRVRSFSIEPDVFEDIFCWLECNDHLAGETVDMGLELGALSQWNLGPFFFSVEWFGLYQPLITLDAAYVRHTADGRERRSKADWRGIDLPAEIRVLNIGGGLTF